MAQGKVGQSGDTITSDEPVYITDSEVIRDSESASGNNQSDERETFPTINPGDIITSEPDTGESGPKRRGRPRGSKNRTYGNVTSKKEASLDLTRVLYSIHLTLAAFTGVKELTIDETEAKELSDCVVRLNELYGGIVLPEKTLAWINLGIVGAKVYGTRFAAYNMRKEHEKKQKAQTLVQQPTATMFVDPIKVNTQH